MSLLAYQLKNLLLGLLFTSITYAENSMSEPKSAFSCEVASTSFALQIFLFFGSDSSTAARLLCDSIFFDGFLFRADTRGVGEGDRGGFFDANKLFCPTRSDTSEFGSESESKDTTKTGAWWVEWLVSDWEKTGYRGGVVDGSENKGLSWGGDEYASNAAYSASYLALISSCLFALRRALVLSASAAIAASVPVIFRAMPFLLGKLRSFGSLRGRGSCGSRVFRLFSRASTASTTFAFWVLNMRANSSPAAPKSSFCFSTASRATLSVKFWPWFDTDHLRVFRIVLPLLSLLEEGLVPKQVVS